MNRRSFLKNGSMALGALAASPLLLHPRTARAGTMPKRLVLIYNWGAFDGLHLFPPKAGADFDFLTTGEKPARPALAVPQTDVLDVGDPRFGFHKKMAPLADLYRTKEMAVIMGTGFRRNAELTGIQGRSHFVQIGSITYGTPSSSTGTSVSRDGIVNRILQRVVADAGRASPFNGVAIQPSIPPFMGGPRPVIATNKFASLSYRSPASKDRYNDPRGRRSFVFDFAASVESLFKTADDALLGGVLASLGIQARTINGYAATLVRRESRDELTALGYNVGDGLHQRLIEAAGALKADSSSAGRNEIQILSLLGMSGVDTHFNQVASAAPQSGGSGSLALTAENFAKGLATFVTDLKAVPGLWEQTMVVVVTEFGRTIRQNGSNGTDHGRGSHMMVLGGGLRSAQKRFLKNDLPLVEQDKLGLSDSERTSYPGNGRGMDLVIRYDLRSVISKVCERHLGISATGLFENFSGAHDDEVADLRALLG